MVDDNPLGLPPVYEEDQVITQRDLIALRNGFTLQYNSTPIFSVSDRWKFRYFVLCMDLLIAWIDTGKSAVFKGKYDETTGEINPY